MVDRNMEFLFQYSTRHLTCSLRSLVSNRVERAFSEWCLITCDLHNLELDRNMTK